MLVDIKLSYQIIDYEIICLQFVRSGKKWTAHEKTIIAQEIGTFV